jgi:predicted dehydrogenase
VGDPHGVVVVGLGNVSGAYLRTISRQPAIRVVAVTDLDRVRADAVAAEYGAEALSLELAVAHPDVLTVLNLTTPTSHADIALAALAAGRHVYGEKPLARTVTEADRVLAVAERKGVRVGCAPDSVLGTGVQTARAAVDTGLIGEPVSATAAWVAPGHERWHPNPDFYYRDGGGPLLDIGPYYLSALVHLLGPIASVQGAARRARDRRTIATGPRAGTEIPVEVATHVTGVLEHVSGLLSSVTLSFDGAGTSGAPIEVHGTEGWLRVPDPIFVDGEVRLFRADGSGGELLTPSAGYLDSDRGVGLFDMLATDDEPRAGGLLARHVLEVMVELLAASDDGCRRPIRSRVERPAPVPLTPRSLWSRAEPV